MQGDPASVREARDIMWRRNRGTAGPGCRHPPPPHNLARDIRTDRRAMCPSDTAYYLTGSSDLLAIAAERAFLDTEAPASPTSPFRAGSRPGSRSPICEDPSGPISSRGPRCQEHLPQNRAIDRTLDTDANIAQLDLNHAGLGHHRRRRRVTGHHHRYECRAASRVAPGIFRGFRRLAPPEKQKTGADVMTPGDLRHAAAWLKALSHEGGPSSPRPTADDGQSP